MLHLYVFSDYDTVIGVEAYSREQALKLATDGCCHVPGVDHYIDTSDYQLVYCQALKTNGGPARIRFSTCPGGEGALEVNRS